MAERKAITVDGERFLFTFSDDGACSHNKGDKHLMAQLRGDPVRPYYLADVLVEAVEEKVLEFSAVRQAAKALTLWFGFYELGPSWQSTVVVPVTAIIARVNADESTPFQRRGGVPRRFEDARYDFVRNVPPQTLLSVGEYVGRRGVSRQGRQLLAGLRRSLSFLLEIRALNRRGTVVDGLPVADHLSVWIEKVDAALDS